MKLEDLQKKIKHCEDQIQDINDQLNEIENEKMWKEVYMSVYGATLNYLTTDWEDEASKPTMKVFMKNNLSERAFDFWDRFKDDLFDVLVNEREYLSELEWNHRITR